MAINSSNDRYSQHIAHPTPAEMAGAEKTSELHDLTIVSKNLEKEAQIADILSENLSHKPEIAMRDVIEYALTTTSTLSKTEHILDKLLLNFGAYEGITSEPSLIAKELVPASIELLAQGFESVDFLNKSMEYYQHEQELSTKNSEKQKLEIEQATFPPDSKEFASIDSKLAALEEQIEALKSIRENFIKETVKFTVNSAIAGTKVSAEIGLSAAKVGSHAAHALHIVGPVASLGGSVAVGVTSAIGLADDLKVTDLLITKIQELTALRNSLEKGTLVRDIVEVKLHQLEQQYNEVTASTLRNFTGCITSLLGTGASIGAIVGATGVSLGVVGGAVVASTGIGAAVIGAGVAIGGAAYAIHSNRDRIAHSLEEAKIAIETSIHNTNYQQMKSSLEEMHTLREQEQAFLKETETRKKKIDNYIKPIIEELNSDSIKKATLQHEIHALEKNQGGPLLDQLKAPFQILALKQEIKNLDQSIKERKAHISGILEVEEKQQKLSEQKIHDTTAKLYGALEEIQATKEKVFALKEEDTRLKEEGRYVGWAKSLGEMKWTDVRKLHSDFGKRMKDDSISNAAVREFLQNQNHSLDGFTNDPATVILEYLAKEVTA